MINSQAKKLVCVQGLGFVGSAMSVAVASASDASGSPIFEVVGIDLPTASGQKRIDSINSGLFPFTSSDEKLVVATSKTVAAGNLRATSEADVLADADVVWGITCLALIEF